MSAHDYPDGQDGAWEPIELTCWTVERGDSEAECTLFPRDVDGRVARMSAWMTATGDSFVDCQEMR